MGTKWLPGALIYDLTSTRGNGPWPGGGAGRGAVLHVNVSENGTDYHWFGYGLASNPNSVCPNWQIYKSKAAGGTVQLLPFYWQSWCQAAGNSWGPSIETAGMPGEPLTDFQMDEIARIYKIGHDDYGWKYQITDSVSGYGFGTHAMGGASWGGHPCPGTIRAGQRATILSRAQGASWMTEPISAANLTAIANRVWAQPEDSQIDPTKTYSAGFILTSTNKDANDAEKAALAAGQKADAATQAVADLAVKVEQASVQAAQDKTDILNAIGAINTGGGTVTGKHEAVVDFGGTA